MGDLSGRSYCTRTEVTVTYGAGVFISHCNSHGGFFVVFFTGAALAGGRYGIGTYGVRSSPAVQVAQPPTVEGHLSLANQPRANGMAAGKAFEC